MEALGSRSQCVPGIGSALEGEELRLHSAAARLQEVAVRLQAISAVHWESPAARRFRDGLAAHRAAVDTAVRLLEAAAAAVGTHAAATLRLENPQQ